MRVLVQRAALVLFSALLVTSLEAQTNQEPVEQQSKAAESTNPEVFFRDCTPVEFAVRDCKVLERLVAPRLREVGEKSLADSANPYEMYTYRVTFLAFVSSVPARVATIVVQNDSIVEITSKTEGLDDKIRSLRQLQLSRGDSDVLLALLQWDRFSTMDSSRHIVNDPTRQITDGNMCSLEGAHLGKFHAIYRNQIERSASLDPPSDLLMRLYEFLDSRGAWRMQ
jgi:hypothetical protein